MPEDTFSQSAAHIVYNSKCISATAYQNDFFQVPRVTTMRVIVMCFTDAELSHKTFAHQDRYMYSRTLMAQTSLGPWEFEFCSKYA